MNPSELIALPTVRISPWELCIVTSDSFSQHVADPLKIIDSSYSCRHC